MPPSVLAVMTMGVGCNCPVVALRRIEGEMLGVAEMTSLANDATAAAEWLEATA